MARKTNSAILSGAGGPAPFVQGGEHGPQMKNARWRGGFLILAEWTGLAHILRAAAALASAALRFPPEAAQAASSTPQNEKRPLARAFLDTGGVDGTRTRDPRRDRPVF
ncbi:exported hypothetical protein [Cupriavidus taiwanensis]|nr:exported hypothetical protein [Cupriavidus taiwanensis]SOY59227.1 exported hypothetical protein [Cupriavidus taiwanensis]SOY80188.1 exported hypothetical protein [Cupriavidus taiwanensis]SOZ76241.1 exported hypothetical protein [Cupriavidus taiwanensis]SOZ76769.1 exported hypothetical protein [Cupriavidus taiwanensis]